MNDKSIVLCGFMGCGKTTIARLLAKELHMEYVDTDDYVRQIAGESIHDMLARDDMAAVRAWEVKAVEELAERKGCVIATGAGVCAKEPNAKAFSDSGFLVYIKRDFDVIYPKIYKDPVRLVAYQKPYHVVKELHDKRIPIYSKYADLIVENNGSKRECVKKIIEAYRGNTKPESF